MISEHLMHFPSFKINVGAQTKQISSPGSDSVLELLLHVRHFELQLEHSFVFKSRKSFDEQTISTQLPSPFSSVDGMKVSSGDIQSAHSSDPGPVQYEH